MRKLLSLVLLLPSLAFANNATVTAQYFNHIKHNPQQLTSFVAQMPKGGDLHDHLTGAVYAEDAIRLAANDGFCVNSKTFSVSKAKNCPEKDQLKNLPNNFDLYTRALQAWSLLNYVPGQSLPEANHFFNTFILMAPFVNPHRGEILASLAQRAYRQHEDYLELLILPKTSAILSLGSQLKWSNDLNIMRNRADKAGISAIAKQMSAQVNQWQQTRNKLLHCGTQQADPACQVVQRFNSISIRTFAPQMMFAQVMASFMLAAQNPNVLGVNIVGPEQNPIALRDYTLHMKMYGYFHKLYPKVHITLHAGELVTGEVPPRYLSNHIRQAIEIGHAERIGHGVDVAHETDSKKLLQEMASQHIAVEEALTSNQKLLHVTGNQQPIMLYWRSGVPVTLNTDDAGPLRTDMNHEYVKAIMTYGLSYTQVKQLAFNALRYSFLPAKQQAQLEVKLTQQFNQFESKIAGKSKS